MNRRSQYAQQRLDGALMKLRLMGRHEGGTLRPEIVGLWLEDYPDLTEAAIRQAFAEGVEERASGVRCMCTQCEIDKDRIIQHAQLRVAYGLRRMEELRAAGVGDDQARQRIDAEIANGAALRGTTHNEAGR